MREGSGVLQLNSDALSILSCQLSNGLDSRDVRLAASAPRIALSHDFVYRMLILCANTLRPETEIRPPLAPNPGVATDCECELSGRERTCCVVHGAVV